MELDLKKIVQYNLTKRIFSILLILPLIFFCIYLGSFFLKILIILISILLSIEWFGLTQKKNNNELYTFIFLIIFNLFICFFFIHQYSIINFFKN